MKAAAARLTAWLKPARDDAPLIDQADTMTIGQVVRRFWPRVKPLRGWIALSLAFTAVLPLIEVVEILLFQRVVDDVLVPAEFAPLLSLALIYITLNVVASILSGVDDYLSTWISQKFLVPLRRDAFEHVLALPSHVLDRRKLGDVIARLTQDVNSVERFMVSSLADAIGSIARLIFFVGALFWLSWELALISVIGVPALWFIARRFAEFTKTVARERRRRGGSLSSVTEESLGNAMLMQLYGVGTDAVGTYDRQNRGIADAELTSSKVQSVFSGLVGLVELLSVLVVLTGGVWALTTDRLTLGGLLAFTTLLLQCYRPIRELTELAPDLFEATAGIERLTELLEEPSARDHPEARALALRGGAIDVDDVTVRYPGSPTPVLSRFDLSVAAGSCIAVTGVSGSGKSTLVRLITGQLTPENGSVQIDGQDLSRITRASLRRAVAVVMQETLLLDTSVRDSVRLARPDASDEEVEIAARAADAHGFISELPDGYDTRIGQRGRLLSGGQRQRVSLARAFLCDAPILILDEPTTGLDEASSRRLMDAVMANRGSRTVIVMTHDPLALSYADQEVRLGREVQPA